LTVIGAPIEDVAGRAGFRTIREVGERLANSGRCALPYLDDQHTYLTDISYVIFRLKFIPRYGKALGRSAAAPAQAVDTYSGAADGVELAGAAVGFDPPTPAIEAAGLDEAERVPLPAEHDPESIRLQTSGTARLYPDDQPGPPTGNTTAG
jgi:hypothetical protein